MVHHKVALADGGPDDEGNMITLCGDCHRGWHHHVEGWVSFDLFMKETSKVVSTPHSERVRAGLKRTKAKGTRLGRKPVAPAVEAQIRALKGEGNGILKIAKIVGVGTSVVQRVVAQSSA
jgi:HNH endonuclease